MLIINVKPIRDKPSKYIPIHWLVYYLPQCLAPLRNIIHACWIGWCELMVDLLSYIILQVVHLFFPTTSHFQFDHSWLWDSSNMCSPKHFPNSPQWNAELLGKTHYPQKRRSGRFWPRTCQLGESPPAENFRSCGERGQNRKDRLAASNRIYFQRVLLLIFFLIYISLRVINLQWTKSWPSPEPS